MFNLRESHSIDVASSVEIVDEALSTRAKRVFDVTPSEMFAEFMKTGWALTPLAGVTQGECITNCARSCAELSQAFTGPCLVIASGGLK